MIDKDKTGQIIIKRYRRNRKLYNTRDKTYINLRDILIMNNQGVDFRVIEHDNGEDITLYTNFCSVCLSSITHKLARSGKMDAVMRKVAGLSKDLYELYNTSLLEEKLTKNNFTLRPNINQEPEKEPEAQKEPELSVLPIGAI